LKTEPRRTTGRAQKKGIAMNNSRIRQLMAFLLAGAVSGYAGTVSAAGFALIENSAQGMGNAFAGGGAVAEDASTLWFNPASITRLPSQMQGVVHYISPSFEFTDGGSTFPGGAIPGAPTNDGGEDAFVPNFYYIRALNERWSFGLAVNAPFGLRTEYDNNWTGRYHALESEIVDLNVNPALAWKVNEVFSVGFGVSLNYIDATLNNAVDFGLIAGGPGAAGTADGFTENTADDISFGFNFGFFYEPNERTRYSMAYRSQINHKLEGDAVFTGVPAPLDPFFFNDGISVGASLPDTFSLSAFHLLTPMVGLMADATWTGWSEIPELRIVYDNPANAGGAGTAVEPLGWKNAWRLSLGLNYYQSSRLTLRTGVAYDQSPVPNPVQRTPRLPDNDRVWLSVGASYHINEKITADFGYSHLFIDDTNIARTNNLGATLVGTYESSADIFSLGINYYFD
jgi:long-chain fatty acid transport protein